MDECRGFSAGLADEVSAKRKMTNNCENDLDSNLLESGFGKRLGGNEIVPNLMLSINDGHGLASQKKLTLDYDPKITGKTAQKRKSSPSVSQESTLQIKGLKQKLGKSKNRRKKVWTLSSSESESEEEMAAKRQKTKESEIDLKSNSLEFGFGKQLDRNSGVPKSLQSIFADGLVSQGKRTSDIEPKITAKQLAKKRSLSSSSSDSQESTLQTERLKQKVRKCKNRRRSSWVSSSSESEEEMPAKRKKLSDSESDWEPSLEETGRGKQFTGKPSRPSMTPSFGVSLLTRPKLVSDFDLMLAARKARKLTAPKRKAKDEEKLINFNEGQIRSLLLEMKAAATADRELYLMGLPATKKMTLFPRAMSQLAKLDLREAFMENDLVGVLAEWLTPMGDGSLPALKIRDSFIKLISELPGLDLHQLKTSGLGKVFVELVKSPKETKANKMLAIKLIKEWSLPFFPVSASVAEAPRKDKPRHDPNRTSNPIRMEQGEEPVMVVPKRRDFIEELNNPTPTLENAKEPIRPEGELKPFPRAVRPSLPVKNFINRPKWTSNANINKPPRKTDSRLDRVFRNFKRMKDMAKAKQAVKVSINGRN